MCFRSEIIKKLGKYHSSYQAHEGRNSVLLVASASTQCLYTQRDVFGVVFLLKERVRESYQFSIVHDTVSERLIEVSLSKAKKTILVKHILDSVV